MTERDVMQYDVVIVGAGPAGLACAIRLKQQKDELNICVLEKASEIGQHSLSGAVVEPQALDELLPDWRDNPPEICVPAKKDEFYFLTQKRSIRFVNPPQLHNKGNFILSLGALCRKLATHAEEIGIDIFAGFAGAEILYGDSNDVIGVRCGDMGVNHDGSHGPNYTPGVDIHARHTVLAEGCRGSLSKQLIVRYNLDEGKSPQTYGIGFKELWRLPDGRVDPGLIRHTIGWPLDRSTYGGSFLYHLDNEQVYIGFVSGLDYQDPQFSPFEAFQQFKHHPSVMPLLEGGEILSAGTRAIIEGGYQSLPKLEMPGAMLIGDAGGTLNVPKIKGVHMALGSGICAADHLAEKDSSEGFDEVFRRGARGRELYKVRNIRPGFRGGLWRGLANAALETVALGKTPWTLSNHADWASLKKQSSSQDEQQRSYVSRTLEPRDRLASVYYSTIAHEENQPVHLKVRDTSICATRCAAEYDNPCTRFCPANVYEMVDDGSGGKKLQINAANCLHCKVCDIKDPYEIIDWVPPEGGSGPNYQNM
ncbi:MAG: electron transfer flavoprotein-ubiquinone oxidoreductase [Gammaproteobacteria bacterium]|nr:electron transfer flavoprotein-ubiquinone oxidoreductase [Gammaproteobacteria bacterium]